MQVFFKQSTNIYDIRHSDDSVVLAKVSPHSVRLEREYYVSKRLYSLAGGDKFIANATEYVSLVQDGLAAIIYSNVKQTDCIYFGQDQQLNYHSLCSLGQLTNNADIWDHCKDSCTPKFIHPSLDTFLDFAIECCSALQFLHENGVVHGELRPSAFQCGYADGKLQVKIWNFGGGLNSYEELLLTSSRWRSFMATTDGSSNTNNSLIPTPPPLPPLPATSIFNPHAHDNLNDEPNYFSDMNVKSRKHNSSRFYSPKEFQTSLIYVSPEQTGRTSNALDHRADLYSLGIMFYVILTDKPPFEGSAMDVVHSILSKNVPLVHTIRKDIPPVISSIIDKLTRKVKYGFESSAGLC